MLLRGVVHLDALPTRTIVGRISFNRWCAYCQIVLPLALIMCKYTLKQPGAAFITRYRLLVGRIVITTSVSDYDVRTYSNLKAIKFIISVITLLASVSLRG